MQIAKILGLSLAIASIATVSATPAFAMHHRHKVCKVVRHHGHKVRTCHWAR